MKLINKIRINKYKHSAKKIANKISKSTDRYHNFGYIGGSNVPCFVSEDKVSNEFHYNTFLYCENLEMFLPLFYKLNKKRIMYFYENISSFEKMFNKMIDSIKYSMHCKKLTFKDVYTNEYVENIYQTALNYINSFAINKQC